MIISGLSRLLDFVAPRFCPVCGCRLSVAEDGICGVCNLRLPRTGFHAHPYDNPMARLFWGRMPIERAASLFYYAGHSGVSHAIYALKYHSQPWMGVVLGRLAAKEMLASGFFEGIDLLVPVPLARDRRRERGYNQSEMIAKGIHELTGITINARLLRRCKFEKSQTHLNRWERMDNVEGLFSIVQEDKARGKHILLVDDVVTTGATVTACASALQKVQGVKISVLSLGFAHS